jgi:hypothetical protein
MDKKARQPRINYFVHFTTSRSDWNHVLKWINGIALVIGPLFIDIIDIDVYI